MKKLSFSVDININPVIVLPSHSIVEISIKDESLGYIYIEKNGTQADCVTPFTELGTLPDTDCIQCAMKALFADRTFMKIEQIDIAEEVDSGYLPGSRIKNMLLSAMLKGSSSIN